jgi:hypothetical protein
MRGATPPKESSPIREQQLRPPIKVAAIAQYGLTAMADVLAGSAVAIHAARRSFHTPESQQFERFRACSAHLVGLYPAF